MSIFFCDNFFCVVEKELDEIHERYLYRCRIITNNKPQTKSDYDRLVILSRYASNMKYLKCKYDDNITQQCQQIIK